MKNNLVRISILVFGAVAVSAQSVSTVKVNIPFDFSVPGASMPAGAYSVDLNPYTLTLRAMDAGVIASVTTGQSESVLTREGASLVFHRIGDRYFLAEVWAQGTYGRHLPVSKQERGLAKRGTSPGSAPDRVIVAAR